MTKIDPVRGKTSGKELENGREGGISTGKAHNVGDDGRGDTGSKMREINYRTVGFVVSR